MAEQGEIWQAYIQRQLDGEERRRTRLDDRAQATISQGAFFAVLLGFLTALAGSKPVVGSASRWVLCVALLLAASTAVAALYALRLVPVRMTGAVPLTDMTGEHWGDDARDCRNIVAQEDVESITSLRSANDDKAKCIVVANYLQIAAICAVTVAIVLALSSV